MGNKKNRAPKRKNQFRNRLKNLQRKTTDKKTNIMNAANNITTVNPIQPKIVDVFSIVCPISDVKYEHTVNPITPTNENLKEDVQDPLFVVKSEIESPSTSNKQFNEIPNVETTIAVVKIEPIENENVIPDEENSIAFENKCRLCLTKEESNWIEIFSSKPYPYTNVDEITPSNILEIIEQFTTIKISKDDRLPDKLCLKCFQSLRFIYKFREKSLQSQNLLNSEVNALRKSTHEQNQHHNETLANGIQLEVMKRLVKDVRMKPIRMPIPNPKKVLTFEEAFNIDIYGDQFDSVQCEVCGEIFDKYKPFQYHLNRHHDVRPFACTEPYCDKSFYSPQNRQTHILNVHSIERKFKCDLCEKTYNRAEKLTNHRTTHFPPTIPCTICGKLLRSQASVRKHRASHSERMYKCDDCSKSFQNSYTLKVHQRIHTNEKPFICSKCGEAFAHKCSLKAHDQIKHPD